jgi:redox-sensitive bicupin YhaK (pirin superfamily)
VLFGEIDGLKSSIQSEWDTLYLDLEMSKGSKFELKPLYHDRALYIISGNIFIMGEQCPNQTLIVLKPNEDVILEAHDISKMLVLGGEPMDGPRYIYWNFVSSRKEKIEEAKNKWKNWEFPKIRNDNSEFIPLP